jgi:hypothetical protein
MSKKELIKKYKDDFVIIQSLFNLLDPCGLIQSGSPIDEYDCLTTQILSGLYQNKSNQDMEDLILTELDHHFGTISKSEISDAFSKDLNKFINEIKLKIKPSC